jgi:hypothetical protein
MGFRLWALCWIFCVLGAGCAAPMRTFVSDERASTADTVRSETETTDLVSESQSAKVEANPVKPSVWTQWMGAFSMQPPNKALAKPTERIPLPRTDLEKPGEEIASELDAGFPSDF